MAAITRALINAMRMPTIAKIQERFLKKSYNQFWFHLEIFYTYMPVNKCAIMKIMNHSNNSFEYQRATDCHCLLPEYLKPWTEAHCGCDFNSVLWNWWIVSWIFFMRHFHCFVQLNHKRRKHLKNCCGNKSGWNTNAY